MKKEKFEDEDLQKIYNAFSKDSEAKDKQIKELKIKIDNILSAISKQNKLLNLNKGAK